MDFLRKLLAGFAAFYVSRANSCVDLLWNLKIFILPSLWAKKYFSFSLVSLSRLPKRHSTYKREKIKAKGVFFAETVFQYHFRTFIKKMSDVWANKFWQDFQNCFLCVQSKFLSRKLCHKKKFFNLSSLWAEKQIIFCWNFLARLPKRHSTCPKKTFEEKRFFLRTCNLCINFWLSARNSDFYRDILGRVVKNPTHMSGKTFCRSKKNFEEYNSFSPFLQFQQKYFSPQANLSREGCQSKLMSVQRNVS